MLLWFVKCICSRILFKIRIFNHNLNIQNPQDFCLKDRNGCILAIDMHLSESYPTERSYEMYSYPWSRMYLYDRTLFNDQIAVLHDQTSLAISYVVTLLANRGRL